MGLCGRRVPSSGFRDLNFAPLMFDHPSSGLTPASLGLCPSLTSCPLPHCSSPPPLLPPPLPSSVSPLLLHPLIPPLQPSLLPPGLPCVLPPLSPSTTADQAPQKEGREGGRARLVPSHERALGWEHLHEAESDVTSDRMVDVPRGRFFDVPSDRIVAGADHDSDARDDSDAHSAFSTSCWARSRSVSPMGYRGSTCSLERIESEGIQEVRCRSPSFFPCPPLFLSVLCPPSLSSSLCFAERLLVS